MKYTTTFVLSNLLLTPSLIDCWGFNYKYLSRGGTGTLHRRDYEAFDASQSLAHHLLKDPKVATIRRRDLNNPEEAKLSIPNTDANEMKVNTETDIFRSDTGSRKSNQLFKADSEPDKLEATSSELGDNSVDMNLNENIVSNNENSNRDNQRPGQFKAESLTHNLIGSEDNNVNVQKFITLNTEPLSSDLETLEDRASAPMIDTSSLDNNNNNNSTDGLLIKHRKDGYLELPNNQNNSSSNSFDSETSKLTNNSDGDEPKTSIVQPLPIDLKAEGDEKLALNGTDSTAINSSAAGNVDASTKNKIRIVDRAEVSNNQNNVNNSTGSEINNIDDDLSDIKFQNELENFESLRDGYWSVM